MFLLVQISEDAQLYNGEASLQDAHDKSWYRIQNAYYIMYYCTTAILFFQSLLAFKTKFIIRNSLIALEEHPSNETFLENEVKEVNNSNSQVSPTQPLDNPNYQSHQNIVINFNNHDKSSNVKININISDTRKAFDSSSFSKELAFKSAMSKDYITLRNNDDDLERSLSSIVNKKGEEKFTRVHKASKEI